MHSWGECGGKWGPTRGMSIRGTRTVRASSVGGDNLQGVKISVSDAPRWGAISVTAAPESSSSARAASTRRCGASVARTISSTWTGVGESAPRPARIVSVASTSRFIPSADGTFSIALQPAFFVSAGRSAGTSAAAPNRSSRWKDVIGQIHRVRESLSQPALTVRASMRRLHPATRIPNPSRRA